MKGGHWVFQCHCPEISLCSAMMTDRGLPVFYFYMCFIVSHIIFHVLFTFWKFYILYWHTPSLPNSSQILFHLPMLPTPSSFSLSNKQTNKQTNVKTQTSNSHNEPVESDWPATGVGLPWTVVTIPSIIPWRQVAFLLPAAINWNASWLGMGPCDNLSFPVMEFCLTWAVWFSFVYACACVLRQDLLM